MVVGPKEVEATEAVVAAGIREAGVQKQSQASYIRHSRMAITEDMFAQAASRVWETVMETGDPRAFRELRELLVGRSPVVSMSTKLDVNAFLEKLERKAIEGVVDGKVTIDGTGDIVVGGNSESGLVTMQADAEGDSWFDTGERGPDGREKFRTSGEWNGGPSGPNMSEKYYEGIRRREQERKDAGFYKSNEERKKIGQKMREEKEERDGTDGSDVAGKQGHE